MESNPLTAALYSSASHGTVTLNSDGGFTYVPTLGYVGSDSFQYRAHDGTSYSSAATVTLQSRIPGVLRPTPKTASLKLQTTSGRLMSLVTPAMLRFHRLWETGSD